MFDSANHSAKWKPHLKLDLQTFAGEADDAILPEGFNPEPAPPPAGDPPAAPNEDPIPPWEKTPPASPQDPPADPTKPPAADGTKIKVKYNHEEKELGVDEAVPLIQKGMNYDKLQEKLQALESDPGRKLVESLAAANNMTVEQYVKAVQEETERQQLNELVQKNIPKEIAEEIVASRKDRQEREREKAAKDDQAKRDAELTDFIAYFQEENGRAFDPDKDTIPKEVWEANAKGTPLKFAYMNHMNKQLRTQLQIAKQNEENTQRAPVRSVTEHGGGDPAPDDDFMKGFNSV